MSSGQRSQYVGAFPGYFHCVPAGVVDAPDLQHIVQKEVSHAAPVEPEWLLRAPGDHINIRILQTMVSGVPLALGFGARKLVRFLFTGFLVPIPLQPATPPSWLFHFCAQEGSSQCWKDCGSCERCNCKLQIQGLLCRPPFYTWLGKESL